MDWLSLTVFVVFVTLRIFAGVVLIELICFLGKILAGLNVIESPRARLRVIGKSWIWVITVVVRSRVWIAVAKVALMVCILARLGLVTAFFGLFGPIFRVLFFS